jgi:zinc transport system ATP-binding protein
MHMESLLEIRNMSAGYDKKVVLNDVNLTVNPEDFIGVIGPNGGGKTTLLKTILGLLPPIKGEIVFNESMREGDHHHIGYLPQVNRIDQKFPITVFDVVRSGLMSRKRLIGRYSREENERTTDLLQKMGIYALRKKAVGELSGGQLQRVLLCRALVNRPRLLILDEPNTYVDNKFERELYERLRILNKDMAIILVSHDVGTITSYVKTIACVNRTLHYHPSNKITTEQLAAYECPIQVISHGQIPHTVLLQHDD